MSACLYVWGAEAQGDLRGPDHRRMGAGARGGLARQAADRARRRRDCVPVTYATTSWLRHLPASPGRQDRKGFGCSEPEYTPRPGIAASTMRPPADVLIKCTRPETEPPTRVLSRGCGAGGDWSAVRCCGEASGGCAESWSGRKGSAGRFSVTLSPCSGERAGCW